MTGVQTCALPISTIVTTIHQPSLTVFRQFDNLIMISKDQGGCGALAYFGPAYPDSIAFFDPASAKEMHKQPGFELRPEMLLTGLAKKKTLEWVSDYEQSQYKAEFVRDRKGRMLMDSVHGLTPAACASPENACRIRMALLFCAFSAPYVS